MKKETKEKNRHNGNCFPLHSPPRRTICHHITLHHTKISASSITTLLYTWGVWSTKMRVHMDRGFLTPVLGCCRSEWASCSAHPHPHLLSHSLSTYWQRKTFWRKGLRLSPCLYEDQQHGLLPVASLCRTHAIQAEIMGHNPAKNTTYAGLYACE